MIIYRTEILGTTMNNVQDIIVKCSEIIRCDSIHHLRLPYRNLIFEQLSPLKRGILVFEDNRKYFISVGRSLSERRVLQRIV